MSDSSLYIVMTSYKNIHISIRNNHHLHDASFCNIVQFHMGNRDCKIFHLFCQRSKKFVKGIKPVYKAVNKEAAVSALNELDEKWRNKYQIIMQSWNNIWEKLSTYFDFPLEIRRIIH